MLTLSTINFARDVLLNFATHYPSSFRKAVIINAPSFIPRFWGFVSGVLPNSVKAKVVFKGDDFWETLQEDLTEEALAWVRASHADLVRADARRRRAAHGAGGDGGGQRRRGRRRGAPPVVTW